MIKKYRKKVEESHWYNGLVTFLKGVHLKKSNTSLYAILVILINKIQKDELLDRSYSVAFSFTIAIFPLIIFLFTLVPYLHTVAPNIDNDNVMTFLKDVMPETTFKAAASTIQDIISRQRGDLLSLGFIMALILATNGMTSLMSVFNKIHRTVENRGFIKARLIATGLTMLLALVLFIAVPLLVIANLVVNFMVENGIITDDYLVFIFFSLRFLIIFLMFQFTISCIYYFAPAVHDKLAFFSPGSIVATLLSVFASFGFSFYINNFGTYNKLYGSIGALIALMIWLSMLSFILLIGFEINASVDKGREAARDELRDEEELLK